MPGVCQLTARSEIRDADKVDRRVRHPAARNRAAVRHAEERRIGVSSTTFALCCAGSSCCILWWSDVEGLGLRLFLFVLGRRRHFELGIDDLEYAPRGPATGSGGPRKR